MAKLKVYTDRGLMISRTLRSEDHLHECLVELACNGFKLVKIYISTAKGSKELHLNRPKKRPVYYIRSNGMKSLTLPIDLNSYPVIEVYSDSSTNVINL